MESQKLSGSQDQPQPKVQPQTLQPFRFLDLPGEIRNMIYEYSVASAHRLRPSHLFGHTNRYPDSINKALLQVNKKIYHEAPGIFNSRNTGVVCDTAYSNLIRVPPSPCPGEIIWARILERRLVNSEVTGLSEATRTLTWFEVQNSVPIRELKEIIYPYMICCLDRIHVRVDWFCMMFDRADIKWMRSELNKLAQLLGPMHELIINEGPDPRKVVKVSFP